MLPLGFVENVGECVIEINPAFPGRKDAIILTNVFGDCVNVIDCRYI